MPLKQKPLHFLLPVVKPAALLAQLAADRRGREIAKYGLMQKTMLATERDAGTPAESRISPNRL
jgi:hypothetical protein